MTWRGSPKTSSLLGHLLGSDFGFSCFDPVLQQDLTIDTFNSKDFFLFALLSTGEENVANCLDHKKTPSSGGFSLLFFFAKKTCLYFEPLSTSV